MQLKIGKFRIEFQSRCGFLVVLINILILSSCTSMRPVNPSLSEVQSTKKDDPIRLHLKNGSIYESKFAHASTDSIFTESRTFAFDEIQFIEKPEISKTKSGFAAAGILYLIAGTVVSIIVINQIHHDFGK
jgi:hypothetical protein